MKEYTSLESKYIDSKFEILKLIDINTSALECITYKL